MTRAIPPEARCAESIIDSASGDSYDCTRTADHDGPCRFDPYSARARARIRGRLTPAPARNRRK